MTDLRDHSEDKLREEALDSRGLRFVLWLSLAVLALAWYNFADQAGLAERNDRSDAYFLIDLNRADRAALTLIPGIGPRLAEGIVEARTRSGAFEDLADLDRIKGFGPAKIRAMEKWVFIGPGDSVAPGPAKEDL
jgi:hypothetical protein